MPDVITKFEPALFSTPELHFLLEHLGESPIVALRSPLKPGVCRRHIESVLTVVNEYEQLKALGEGFNWAGIESLTDSITRYLEWLDRSNEMKRRGAVDSTGALISHPSMYMWDEDGRAFKFATDSDAADMVRSEILPDGSRRKFGIILSNPAGEVMPHISDIAPWVKRDGQAARHDDKIIDEKMPGSKTTSQLRCFCGFTQQYDRRDPAKRRMSAARMGRHLRTAKEMVNRHRVLLARGGNAQSAIKPAAETKADDSATT